MIMSIAGALPQRPRQGFDTAVKCSIIAPVFDAGAGVAHGGGAAAKAGGDCTARQAHFDMGEIHRGLADQRLPRRPPARRPDRLKASAKTECGCRKRRLAEAARLVGRCENWRGGAFGHLHLTARIVLALSI